jgi:hypothetical protein
LVYAASVEVRVTKGYVCLALLKQIRVIDDSSTVCPYPGHFRFVRRAANLQHRDDRNKGQNLPSPLVHALHQVDGLVVSLPNPLVSVAQKAQTRSTNQIILLAEVNSREGSMSRAHVTAGLDDDAIIAFLMFCLEIYQAEQQRKRKLH